MAYKLTPFDAELARMVSNLTGRECRPLVNDDNTYTLIVDYSEHRDPDYIGAIFRAIEGRAGDRMINIIDEPDISRAKAYIRLTNSGLPDVTAMGEIAPAQTESGETYCRKLAECKAVQVRRDNAKQLILFVGNGEMESSEEGPVSFTFRNAFGGVYCTAQEGDYIQFVRDGLYAVISKDDFERLWELK